LNDVLDINLCSAEREQSAGSFSIDLVAEDNDGNSVVIENQLEKSNHDHLGKLITYLSAVEAKAGVWIVKDPRAEHIKAINWLNESNSASFYLIKVEAISIGNSRPAPLLTLIVGPSEEGREVGKIKKEQYERYAIRERFWQQLLDYAKTKTKIHSNISATEHNWLGTKAGLLPGLGLNYAVRQHSIDVELYIDLGKDKEKENLAFFEKLEKQKPRIEKVFGGKLEWQRLEGKRSCRIKWIRIHEVAVDAMIKLNKALNPHIQVK